MRWGEQDLTSRSLANIEWRQRHCLLTLITLWYTHTDRQTERQTETQKEPPKSSQNLLRSPAVGRIADCTGSQWPSRSSKISDFPVIWKPICKSLLVINSNLGPILYCVRRNVKPYELTPVSEIWPVFHWISYPRPFDPQFENVLIALNHWNFECQSLRHMLIIHVKKSFPLCSKA